MSEIVIAICKSGFRVYLSESLCRWAGETNSLFESKGLCGCGLCGGWDSEFPSFVAWEGGSWSCKRWCFVQGVSRRYCLLFSLPLNWKLAKLQGFQNCSQIRRPRTICICWICCMVWVWLYIDLVKVYCFSSILTEWKVLERWQHWVGFGDVAAPFEKALEIVLARDVDGATFWGALDEALVPQLKAADNGVHGEAALADFGKVFQGRALKQGTRIILAWVQPSNLKVLFSLHQYDSHVRWVVLGLQLLGLVHECLSMKIIEMTLPQKFWRYCI